MIEGSLEVKLLTIWTNKKQRGEESEKRREEKKKEDQKRESPRRKKIQVREKVGKSRNTVFFPWFVPAEGRKVGSLKRPVRSPLGRWEMKNCTLLRREAHFEVKMYTKHTRSGPLLEVEMSKNCRPLWREAHFEVKMHKTPPGPDHFWKLRCRKNARRCGAKHISKSKCTKQTRSGPLLEVEMSKKCTPLWREAHSKSNVQSTPGPDHFWKLRCRKIARRCGAKHISKSKCTKHTRSWPLLEVEMSKKCTPSWREAHFEVKMYKTHQVRTTLGKLRCRKMHAVVSAKHISKSKCTKQTRSGPLLEVEMSKNCTPLWREAHFEVKMYKAHQVLTTFGSWDVEKMHAVVARSTFRSQNVNYFTSCDPHHDIYTFSYWQIFWHSIWHIFWHSIWHISWHFIWHLAYLLTFYLAYLLTFFLAYLLTFCLAYLLTFFLTFFLAFYLAYLLTFYLTSFLTFFPLRSGSAHCDLEVAVEVRQCPLRSGSRGWGPAVPIATWKSRLRSGSAHCDLQLAVEVRQCPLGSGARGGGPAVPTGIWTARRRRRVRRRRAEEEKSSVKI